jgi:CHRD domain
MNPNAVSIAFIVPALASSAILMSPEAAFAVPRPFAASLSGSNEVPPGIASLTGRATFTIDVATGQVCSQVTTNVSGAVAMHIHKGARGVNGPIVVHLNIRSINAARVCVSATVAVASAVAANPAGHYLNIHTPAAPGGAVRGQLARQ